MALDVTTTSPIPPYKVGEYYEHQLTATGGDGTYIWKMKAGSLPDGLMLSPSGLISGIPTGRQMGRRPWEYVNGKPPTLAVRQADPGFRIRLVTVPHTGTFFTLGLLKQMGVSHDHRHIKTWNPDLVDYWADRPDHKSWIVCTLRDPMMAIISSTNRRDRGHFVEAWKIPASWRGAPNVHFFPVDGPAGERAQRLRELAEFAGARIPSTDWVPVHASPDVLDLKADYQRGVIKSEIQPAFDALSGLDDVKGLFAAHGYSLPWMA